MTEASPPLEDCWKILDLSKSAYDGIKNPEYIADAIRAAFRRQACEGSANTADMDRLVRARDEAIKQIGARP